MDKLEYYVVKYLQECIRKSESKELPISKYLELDDELIAIIKGKEESELYLITECNLNNMGSDLMKYVRVTENLYKVEWSQVFDFLIGKINESEMDKALLTKELKLIQISRQPLTNFLKSK